MNALGMAGRWLLSPYYESGCLALAMNLMIGLIKSKLERFLTDCWNTQIAPRDLIRGDLAASSSAACAPCRRQPQKDDHG